MMGNPLFVETMNAMGGKRRCNGINELFGALQTGVSMAPRTSADAAGADHYQVSKVYSLTAT